MNIKKQSTLLLASLLGLAWALRAQQPANNALTWWEPAAENRLVMHGQLPALSNTSARLPAPAQSSVRPEVWRLAQNSAGKYLEFTTTASQLTVRYTLAANTKYDHMPTTGISGVDLYAKDGKGQWHWARGAYKFGDTVTFKFDSIAPLTGKTTYRLYYPLYNSPAWLQVGIPAGDTLQPIAPPGQKPLIFYGTSIMQGACASRPGMAWTNILSRSISRPLINLGFSGNGRLEKEVLNFIDTVPAAAFVLDCLPNLHDEKTYPVEEVKKRLLNAVDQLRKAQPNTPILLVEHACGRPGFSLDQWQVRKFNRVNTILQDVWKQLRAAKTKHLYLLTAGDIGLDADCTVDGTHPNDIGMARYAAAYEKILKTILK